MRCPCNLLSLSATAGEAASPEFLEAVQTRAAAIADSFTPQVVSLLLFRVLAVPYLLDEFLEAMQKRAAGMTSHPTTPNPAGNRKPALGPGDTRRARQARGRGRL